MNSKFRPIVKVRKQQLDMVETRLARARFERHELEEKISSTCREIDETTTPKSGSVAVMNMVRERLAIIRKEKDELQSMLAIKEQEIEQLRGRYKRVNTELEKVKYLEEQDFQEWMKKIKKIESLDMDEISNILFVNKEQK